MRLSTIVRYAIAVASIAIVTNPARADYVIMDATHYNGSFEDPVVSASVSGYGGNGSIAWNINTPTGWNNPVGVSAVITGGTDTSGTIVYTAAAGNQFCAMDPYFWLQANITDTYKKNAVYTLSYSQAGDRADAAMKVFLGSTASGTTHKLGYYSTGVGGNTLTWQQHSIVLNTYDNPEFVGGGIDVVMNNPGIDGWTTQSMIDNLQLTYVGATYTWQNASTDAGQYFSTAANWDYADTPESHHSVTLANGGAIDLNAGTSAVTNVGTASAGMVGSINNGSLQVYGVLYGDSGTIGAVVSGTGSLAKVGTGSLVLTGANTYTGGSVISGGTLQLGNGATTGSVAGTITNNATLAVNYSTGSLTTRITGTGLFSRVGEGLVVVSNSGNTFDGGITVNGGTLAMHNWGLGTSTTTNNACMVFVNTSNKTWSNAIGGSGSVVFAGTARTTSNVVHTYTGNTTINAGSYLMLGNSTGKGSIASTTVLNNGSLSISGGSMTDGTRDVDLTGNISGSGRLFKLGANTLILSGQNTYTGDTAIEGGFTLAENGSMTFDVNDVGMDFTQFMYTGGTLGYAAIAPFAGLVDFSGTMNIDASDVSAGVTTGEWNLVVAASGMTTNYGSMFKMTLDGHSLSDADNDNIWTYAADSKLWSFDESTGTLSLSAVPEPGSIVLLASALLGLVAYAWRKRK